MAAHRLSGAGAGHHRGLIAGTRGARSTSASEYGPFFAVLGLFVMSYIGIAISLSPMIVPGHFTCGRPRPTSTQAFLLIGTLFLLPVVLVIYTSW